VFRFYHFSQVDKIPQAYQLLHHTGNIGARLLADEEALE
jgi:hypothetical protein